eukprot:scaffold324135_cov54-Tisochrysis_lutea.AAC.1
MPASLRVSLFHAHTNDGVAALRYLRCTFSAKRDDATDYAHHLAMAQAHVIDGKAGLELEDLRRQYDHINTA